MQQLATKLPRDLTSLHFLSAFQTKVKNLRQGLYRFAHSYPSPLDVILINHYEERLRRAHGHPMLGEYAPFMVGDLFALRPHAIEQLAFPWLLLYEYSLLLDDLIDQERVFSRSELLLSQMLLTSSCNEYRRLIGESRSPWAAYDSYQHEWLLGMLNEMQALSFKEACSPLEMVNQQGRKSAIVKFCAASLVYLDKGRLLSSQEQQGIDHICSGIQLLDDLTNVLEDHREGRHNFILELTHQWFKATLSHARVGWASLNTNQLTFALVYSGSIGRSWNAAADELEKGLTCFTGSESQTAKYFRSISTHCRKGARLIEDARRDLPEFREDFLYAQVVQSNIIEPGSTGLPDSWQGVMRAINDGPKASN